MDKDENEGGSWLRRAVRQGRSVAALLPIMAVVFIGYLVIGLAMPVLPLHVHHRLGLDTFVVGLVAGSQFAATLISRVWAGHQADTRGASGQSSPGFWAPQWRDSSTFYRSVSSVLR